MWKVLVKNNANRFLFQSANLLGIFIHNGTSYYTASALERRSRQTNEPPLWGSCCVWDEIVLNEFFLPVIVVPNSKFYYGNYLVLKQ